MIEERDSGESRYVGAILENHATWDAILENRATLLALCHYNRDNATILLAFTFCPCVVCGLPRRTRADTYGHLDGGFHSRVGRE